MNYRKILAKNKRMTMLVIFTYVLIMAFVGIMADMAVGAVNDLSFVDNMICSISAWVSDLKYSMKYIFCHLVITQFLHVILL